MASIKVGIVEDEMIIAQGIMQTLRSLNYEVTEPAISYTEALGMIVEERPDILLLDIQLKGHKDGIDLARKVKEEYNIPFIFLTANADAATVSRAKELNPNAYLVKPFNKDELYAAIEICLHNFSGKEKKESSTKDNFLIKDYLFIKQGQAYQKIMISDILYVESSDVYVNVCTTAAKMLVRNSMQSFMDMLGAGRLLRVHRGYAVNADHIDTITSESLFVNNVEIPIGKTYKEELMAFLDLK